MFTRWIAAVRRPRVLLLVVGVVLVLAWGMGQRDGPDPQSAASSARGGQPVEGGQAGQPSAPARGGGPFVEVTPSTVETDFLVGIRASCGPGADNDGPAEVDSEAFGTVRVQPQQGFLTATATIPAGQRAGTYRVFLDCPNGRSARTELHVVSRSRPGQGPATGFGGTAGGDLAPFLLAAGLAALAAGGVLGLYTLRRRRHS